MQICLLFDATPHKQTMGWGNLALLVKVAASSFEYDEICTGINGDDFWVSNGFRQHGKAYVAMK